jgi:hypothetical protein
VPATVYLGLNWYMYASPFHTGYHRILVREAGKVGMHSLPVDFDFSRMLAGLRTVLFGNEGFLGKTPLFFAGLVGLLALALRRWREALVLAWCIAIPVAFHAPYTWYRLEFNLPQIAMAVAPLAALLWPRGQPFEEPFSSHRVRWGRMALIGLALLLLLGAAGRRLFTSRGDYFWEALPKASVRLGDVPCDYYNNLMQRWECSHFDNNDWLMTGRLLDQPLAYGGKPQKMLLLHPHPSRQERVLEYPAVPMTSKLAVRYGLADVASPTGSVHLQVTVDGQPLLDEEVTGKGLHEKELDTTAFAGRNARVAFTVRSQNPSYCIFGVGGGPVK